LAYLVGVGWMVIGVGAVLVGIFLIGGMVLLVVVDDFDDFILVFVE
jgi:sRNA-binding regulator protein Hfq